MGQNPNLTAFTSKIQVFCRPEWAKGETPWKWILTIFKWKNKFAKQLGLKKQIKKMGSFVWFSCLLLELWSLNCQKLCPICIFYADVSNKFKAVRAVYVYAFESSCLTLLENGTGCYAMTYDICYDIWHDISVWRWWTSLNFCLLSTFLIFYSSISRELLLRPL